MSSPNRIVVKCFAGAAIYSAAAFVLVPRSFLDQPWCVALLCLGYPIVGILIGMQEGLYVRRRPID